MRGALRSEARVGAGFRLLLLGGFLAWCGLGAARAAAPVIDSYFPLGGQIGGKAKITFSGKLAPWPVGGWVEGEGIDFKAAGTNGVFEISIATNAAPGPRLLRLFNADGASTPRIFMVGTFPEISETEPNDAASKPQVIAKLPVTINGAFDKAGDVDSFAVQLEAGQTLVAEAIANMVGIAIDPVINLRDGDGNKVAFVHDGLGLDPLLAYPVTQGGTYIVQLAGFAYPPAADVRYVGGKSQYYRLSLTAGPYLRHAFPAGIRRGEAATVQLHGWNLGGTNQSLAHLVPAAATTGRVDFAEVTRLGLPNHVRLALGGGVEIFETEPNNTATNAQKIVPPVTINGRIDPAADVDRFTFSAKKGERFELKLLSASLGAPMDALLLVEDATGKELLRVDDSAGDFDARTIWIAPGDGAYVVAVRDLFGKGGSDFVYRLEVGAPVPSFTVAADTHAYAVQVGKTNEFKLTVTPVNGFVCTNLQVMIEGLPEGVAVRVPKIAAKGGEVKVSLVASADAEPSNQPIRVLVFDKEKPALARPAIFTVNAKDTSPELFINSTDSLWLTVTSGPAQPNAAAKKKQKK